MPTDTFRHRAADAAWVAFGAAVITIVIALPVLRSPSTRLFGEALVGRHHDPFTVMRQFAEPADLGLYAQPVTDVPGAWLASIAGPVAAYNWLVLLTFPLAAASAFLLARQVGVSRVGAACAALVFAFSPFHLAQAAYHPHIAQVQWVPLYLLALWRCLDRWSLPAAAALIVAVGAVTLSNLYGGLIAAVITPAAAVSYWAVCVRGTPGAARSMVATIATLALVAVAGVSYVWTVAPAALENMSALAVDRAELFVYSAKWWSYLVPPLGNPWIGDVAHATWASAGVRHGLLEQQVTLGGGVVLLALVAVVAWVSSRGTDSRLRVVPVLAAVAGVALVCSLSPEREIGGITVVRPSAWIYDVAPMFRAYARFGVVVQLMAALLAGIGLDHLRRQRGFARTAAALCLALIVMEYAPAPASLSRDVFPTAAHRWVADRPDTRALDCVERTVESASIPWLSAERIGLLGGPIGDCYEPHLPSKLRALGFTHLIVRRPSEPGRWFTGRPLPAGLRRGQSLEGADLLEVQTAVPAVYTEEMLGLSPREIDGARTWRWMERTAAWGVTNTTGQTIQATLQIELQAFHTVRHLELLVDGRVHHVFRVTTERQFHAAPPVALPPGKHMFTFRAVESPTVADALLHNGDTRALSVAIGAWVWRTDTPAPGPS